LDLEDFYPIFALLFAVGIIFGSFTEWTLAVPFGWAWFVNMLWFAVGFPTLLLIGLLIFHFGVKGSKKLLES
jgi:hypothetical protein